MTQGDLSPRRLQELTHALEAAELEHILIRVPLLATLQEHEVSELARAMQPAVLRDGDYVYRQGDAAKEFYIVLTGSVQKVVESGDGSKPGIPVGEPLGPASFFGQNSLLSDSQIRSCSMKVVGKTELRKLGQYPSSVSTHIFSSSTADYSRAWHAWHDCSNSLARYPVDWVPSGM